MPHAFDRASFVNALWQLRLERSITPLTYLIGRALLRRASRDGQCWPSYDTLAEDVGCCERTAQTAVAALRGHGLLDWQQRRRRWNRMLSNLYTLGPAQKERIKEMNCDSSTAKIADGFRSESVEAALTRLGAVIGAPPDRVMPWLATG